MFCNKHGFTHPLEGAVNAYVWYPKYFQNKAEAEIIIDGVIHHMYPFPVRALDNTDAELNNKEKYEELDWYTKKLITTSSCRSKIGHISICPSKYKVGRIMSDSDKIVSWFKDSRFHGLISCVTGENSNLDNYTRTRKH